MKKILLIQGANLIYLGKGKASVYGDTTADELDQSLYQHAEKHHYGLEIFYTNIEGEAINKVYQALEQGYHGLVMNPGGFTHHAYALRDCIQGIDLPYVEIHISNIHRRHIPCVLAEVSIGQIVGFGVYGYLLALDVMLQHLTV